MTDMLELPADAREQADQHPDAGRRGATRTPIPEAIPRYRFEPSALVGLTRADRILFERFGQGPDVEPDFPLLHAAFEHRVERQPEAVAAEHDGRSIRYRELNDQAERLALELQRLGVGNGDKVGLFLRRSIPMLAAMMATLKLGAAYVPQHVGVAPEAQLRHIVEQTGAKVVLTLSAFVDQIPTVEGCTVLAIDDFLTGPDTRPADSDGTPGPVRPDRAVSPDDECFVLFTSGTTGPPNGVRVTHRNVCNIVLTAPGNLGMGPGVKVAQVLSIAFDMAAWESLGALTNGATLLLRGSDMTDTVARADVVIATPSVLDSVDADRCHGVKVAAVAGEPCPRPLAETWSRFARFYNSCGPTETTIINTAQLYNERADDLSIGGPTPNNTVYVLDENLRPLPIGEVGEMWAGGDCVTAGYLHNQDLTDERYRPDPFLGGGRMMFRTRDLGRWTPHGELEHYGRTDDQVKIRGFRVELDSVSAALETVAGCTKAVTLKLDDRNLVAFVQPADVDPDAAKRAVADALPYYCVPMSVTAMAELPRTSRGKVDKRLLLDGAAAQQSEAA